MPPISVSRPKVEGFWRMLIICEELLRCRGGAWVTALAACRRSSALTPWGPCRNFDYVLWMRTRWFGSTCVRNLAIGDSGGSRHSARGNGTCFPVSHVYFLIGSGPRPIAKLDGEHCRIPLWIRHWLVILLICYLSCGHGFRLYRWTYWP